MKRLALSLLGSLALASLSGARATAQTPTTTTAFDQYLDVEVDGEELPHDGIVYINADQCSDQVNFKFLVQNYTTIVPELEAWVSSTADCNTGANRAIVNNNTPACWLIGSLSQVQGKAEFEAVATTIFRNGADDEKGCPSLGGTKYTVYFVPLDTPTSSNQSSPPEPNTNQKLKGTFTLFTVPPKAPGSVSGQSGESEVGVKWAIASGAVTSTEYRAYFDTSVGSDSTCANTVLKVDSEPPEPDDDTIFVSSYGKALNAKLTNLDAKGVAIDDYVAAAVVTRDIAENESALSQVVCIQRVQTQGFLDACEQDPGCKGGFDSCSLRPATRRQGALVGLTLLAGLAIAFAIRRRHG